MKEFMKCFFRTCFPSADYFGTAAYLVVVKIMNPDQQIEIPWPFKTNYIAATYL